MSNVGFAFIFAFLALKCHAEKMSRTMLVAEAKDAFASCAKIQGVNITQDGKVVCLRGRIDAGMYIGLLKIRDKIKQNPYVVISGPGGTLIRVCTL